MEAELKTKWVAALRSGNYKQNKNWLRAKDAGGEMAYCCLGVLLDIKGGAEWVADDDDGQAHTFVCKIGGKKLIPNTSASEFATKFPDLSVDLVLDLMNKNDGCGEYERQYSFSEITDEIEARL